MVLLEISDKQNNILTVAGEGALGRLAEYTSKYRRYLVFVDKVGFELCGAADYFKRLRSQVHVEQFHQIAYTGKALPIEDIEEVYREARLLEDADVIIAIGGGTVIDLAKIISVAYSNQCEKAEEVLDNKELENNLPMVFLPTTAGTGSETTSFAVVYRDKIKISVQRQSLLPRHIILEPRLLKSLPIPVLNATVLDALAQATESAWAVGGNEKSRDYSRRALEHILPNLDCPNTVDRLKELQLGSYWAGRAINVSKTTLPHAISYPLTAYYGIPHGIAVFLTLPEVAKLNYEADATTCQPGVKPEDISRSFSLLFKLYGVETMDALYRRLMEIRTLLGMKPRLRDYGVKEEKLPFLAAQSINKGRSDNNPRNVMEQEILDLLKRIY